MGMPDDEVFEKAPTSKGLPDGDYDVSIDYAELKRGTKAGDVFTFKFTVISDKGRGRKAERSLFFDTSKGTAEEREEYSKNKAGELKRDLKTLGFDADNWTRANNRPFSQQLEIACRLMIGLHCQIRVKNNGEYSNVYVNKRLADSDGMPPAFGAAEMADGDEQANFGRSATESKDPVPF